jgi:regulator of ribonuclease activity A
MTTVTTSKTTFVTPDLCDDNPESVCVLAPMLKNFGGKKAFGGEIVTVKCFEDNSLVKEHAGNDGSGKVMLVDGGGSLRCALLGDMIAENAVKHKWEGIVIYGCVRDVDALAELDLGVQALASIPIKSNRKGRGDLNVDVTFGGVTFKAGEFIYADNNGVIVSDKKLDY